MCSCTQVFSINLYFCFASAHQSFLPGNGRSCRAAPLPSPKGSPGRESSLVSPVPIPSPVRHVAQRVLCSKEMLNKSTGNSFFFCHFSPKGEGVLIGLPPNRDHVNNSEKKMKVSKCHSNAQPSSPKPRGAEDLPPPRMSFAVAFCMIQCLESALLRIRRNVLTPHAGKVSVSPH